MLWGTESLLSAEIVVDILRGYNLPVNGVHGVSHWGRVLEAGHRIAAQNGADLAVVEYFAVFHDSRRNDEGDDPGHGVRGAALVQEFKFRLGLTEAQLEELRYACRNHTEGATDGSITVQTCWDSDRLDLWRVGIRPSMALLCTAAARDEEILEWSRRRSTGEFIPSCSREWMRLAEAD